MRLTRTALKQLAGAIWAGDILQRIEYDESILKKLQSSIKVCGPKLNDSVQIEFNEGEESRVNDLKTKLGLK